MSPAPHGGSVASNQGIFVRSATGPTWQGLRFATESERQLALALDAARMFFVPVTGCRLTMDGGVRRTRELDFLVVHDGVPAVIELDGAPHAGRAAEDHERDRAIKRSGIWLVERFPSALALKDPVAIVQTLRGMINHLRRTA